MNASMRRAEGRAQEHEGRRDDGSPRLLLSWEDWVTLGAAAIVFVSLAASIQAANLVRDMPPIIPTTIGGLITGLFAARVRASQLLMHPVSVVIGAVVVLLAIQSYAEGATVTDRLADVRLRMVEWFHIVRAGDISNDNLPFVMMVHGIAFAVAYVGTWAVYRWHNAWVAVIPVGVLLLVNISVMSGQPSTAFVFFLFGALVLIARMHLQKRQARWREEGVEYPEFMSLSVAQLAVVVAAALMVAAWMVPLGTQARAVEQTVNVATKPFSDYTDHFVRIFHNLNLRGSGEFYTYGDTLPVRGEISFGTRTLYEIRGLDNLSEAQLLRAASYDEYTGVGWRVSDRTETRLEGGEIQIDAEATYRQRQVVNIEVAVRHNDNVVIFPGIPLGTNLSTLVETASDSPGDVELVRSRRGLRDGDGYNAIGTVSVATAGDLRASSGEYPEWVRERYLQLPGDLPDEVTAAAAEIVSDASSAYDAAAAIENYFRAFPFDPDVPAAPPGRDTVEFLINDLERGHFLYQATGMTVMLRSQGVPARLTIGYVLDPARSADGPPYVVTREDTYAWVEVYFPEYGWVNFNPTGDRPQGGASELEDLDLEGLGEEFFDDPFLMEDWLEFEAEGNIPEEFRGPLAEDPTEAPGPFPWWIVWTFAGMLLAAGAVASAGYVSWNWGLGGLPPRMRLWAKTQRLSGWAGIAPPADETPREWSRRMGRTVESEDAAMKLARAYEEARYGRPDLQGIDDEEALGAYRELRGALVRTILGRKKGSRRGR